MITAHSGADGTKENSLEFVAYAMQTGADALEVDVRMGENGILIPVSYTHLTLPTIA